MTFIVPSHWSHRLQPGDRFGSLVVSGEPFLMNHSGKSYQAAVCRCDCGVYKLIYRKHLIRGDSISCGCIGHGKPDWVQGSEESRRVCPRRYSIWSGMLQRCLNQNCRFFSNYGGRGITVCDEWRTSFLAFYQWSLQHGYQGNLTIDRINNDGNYEPSNCRWATMRQQGNNKRTNRRIEAFGETMTVTEWSRDNRCAVNRWTLAERLKAGWKPEESIMIPANGKRRAS